ncbi:MAG: ATP-binding domain-containing protein, partial [Pirellulales bacterium]|nr:ATP-binding domain-containing protein [Pirellulales bacterium]
QDDEARSIADEIANEVAAKRRRPRDFAIFYRVNALSRGLERALREHGVPYQMIRGQEFYQRKEIKDVLAYCQLINNPRDDQAALRTINTPTRGIGRKTIDLLSEYAYVHGVSLLDAAREAAQVEGLNPRSAKNSVQYAALMDRLSLLAGGALEEILGTILNETKYREPLQGSESEEDLNRLANIEELLTDARQFDEAHPGGGHLEEYLENAWLVNETDDWQAETDKVTMMTLHAAKGLEFPVVYVVAVEQGLLPHERSINDEEQMEEERRLAFVGITRAKEQLQLSYAVQRDFRGQRRRTVPSPFLLEMPREEMELVEVGADHWYPPDWDDVGDSAHEEHDDSHHYDSPKPSAFGESASAGGPAPPSWQMAAAQLTTAAKLAGATSIAAPGVSPDDFAQGMTVMHPEHGPGKIVALSGNGKNRRATVKFATAGERNFVLVHSPLRPAGK